MVRCRFRVDFNSYTLGVDAGEDVASCFTPFTPWMRPTNYFSSRSTKTRRRLRAHRHRLGSGHGGAALVMKSRRERSLSTPRACLGGGGRGPETRVISVAMREDIWRANFWVRFLCLKVCCNTRALIPARFLACRLAPVHRPRVEVTIVRSDPKLFPGVTTVRIRTPSIHVCTCLSMSDRQANMSNNTSSPSSPVD